MSPKDAISLPDRPDHYNSPLSTPRGGDLQAAKFKTLFPGKMKRIRRISLAICNVSRKTLQNLQHNFNDPLDSIVREKSSHKTTTSI